MLDKDKGKLIKKRARQLKKAINAGKMTEHMSEVIFYPHQKILRRSEAK